MRGLVVALCALSAALAAPALANASLPSVSSGARPGPDLLYAPAVDAPQLQNTSPWTAKPILVSGAEAYRNGEFLYQDYLFDDHGGYGGYDDPNDPFNQVENMFATKRGTLSYPTDTATYANNAADLVEFRVKPIRTATAFRVTLNTMKAPDTAAFTIALGDSDEKHAWPHGANVRSPAQLFLTVHGNQADLLRASDGHALSPTPTVTVDPDRRQIEVRLSHEAWNPGRRTVRIAMGAGLWDKQAGNYLQPGPTASATTPGGASPSHEALFNMAFRTDEPVPKINTPGIANTIVEGHVLVQQDATYWRERQQADVLASGDVTPFAADVSFKKLMKKVRDDSAVPRSGDIDRIFASRFVFGQGADFNAKCLTSTAGECSGRYVGQLQPYALYVPKKRLPREGFGLVISMHGLSANYNEFLGSNEARQMADRGTGSIFASPEGRGPDGGYKSYAEADVFEMWADIARSYKLNPALTDVTGYSMGGGGTYRLAGRWPDLFARAFPIVGPPTSAASFKSLRNIPVMAWYGHTDELVGPEMSEEAFLNAEQSGIRYDHWEFVPAGHITEGNNDEYGPAADFFGNHTVDPNPPHVTYLYDPSQDPKALSPSNHAYWISAITLADPSNSGAVDARSHGFGVGDAPVLPVKFSAGTLDGGSHGSIPYERRTIDWGSTPSEPKADTLDVVVSNVASLVIDPQRAQVDCKAKVNLTSDVQTKVILANC
jgi:hypothetical protein